MDLEPIDPATAAEHRREEAFIAAPFHWKDITLQPLAIGREGDWLLHCRRIGLPPLDEVINDVETFLPHACRLVWFCSHEPEEWLAAWMIAPPPISAGVLDGRIRRWIDEHIACGDEAASAAKLALDIFDRAHANHATIVTGGDDDEVGEGSGLARGRSTSRSSARPSPRSRPAKPSTASPRKKAGRSAIATASRTVSSTSGRKMSPKRRLSSNRG